MQVLQDPHPGQGGRTDALPVRRLPQLGQGVWVQPDVQALREVLGKAHLDGGELVLIIRTVARCATMSSRQIRPCSVVVLPSGTLSHAWERTAGRWQRWRNARGRGRRCRLRREVREIERFPKARRMT